MFTPFVVEGELLRRSSFRVGTFALVVRFLYGLPYAKAYRLALLASNMLSNFANFRYLNSSIGTLCSAFVGDR